jgi:CRP/FNR family transcriptional regulator
MNKASFLKKTKLFADLKPPQLKVVAQACLERKLKKGEILFTAGTDARGLFVIAEGSLKAFRVNPDGREQVIHIEKAVATIAEIPVFDDQPYPSSVMAEEDSQVLFIPKQDVRRFCLEYPVIALAALRLLAARLRKTAALVESIALKDVDQRLAAFLCQEAREQGTNRFPLPTNSAIASRLGSVREVVSRAFTRMEKIGWIKLEKDRTVTLLNQAALDRVGGS